MNINKSFLKWFVGFVDAEGNFYTNKKCDTQTFSIHLSLRDKENLYKIENYFKFGKVYEDPKNNRVLYSISKKDILYNKLIPIFEEYPLLTRKFYQYEFWKEILIKRINKVKFDKDLTFIKTARIENKVKNLINLPYLDNWLIGFIEGEGSFMIINDNTNKIMKPKFSICQKYDKEILELIKFRLESNVKVIKEKEDFYRLTFTSIKDLSNLINIIKENGNFNGYKKTQFESWFKQIKKTNKF